MTFQELKEALQSFTEEELKGEVLIFVPGTDNYYRVCQFVEEDSPTGCPRGVLITFAMPSWSLR